MIAVGIVLGCLVMIHKWIKREGRAVTNDSLRYQSYRATQATGKKMPW